MSSHGEAPAALDDEKIRTVLVTAGFVIFAGVAAFTFGSAAVDVALVACVIWLLWERAVIHDLAEQAADDADRADRRVADLVEHINGDDEPTGRHARPKPTPYRREAA